MDRARWLLGIWSGSSSWVGAGGDVFAARRGIDILVLLPLSLSISCLSGGTSTLGWVLRSTGWDWSDFAEEAGQKDLCTGWNDRGQRCGGGRCRDTEAGYKPDVSLHGSRWYANSPGTIEGFTRTSATCGRTPAWC